MLINVSQVHIFFIKWYEPRTSLFNPASTYVLYVIDVINFCLWTLRPGPFCPGTFCPGTFCPGTFYPGTFVQGYFVGGLLSRDIFSGTFCPGTFCPATAILLQCQEVRFLLELRSMMIFSSWRLSFLAL